MNDECAQVLLPLLGGEGRGEGGIAVHGSWKESTWLLNRDDCRNRNKDTATLIYTLR